MTNRIHKGFTIGLLLAYKHIYIPFLRNFSIYVAKLELEIIFQNLCTL